MVRILSLIPFTVGKEIRDRFSGAVEAFARRNATGASPHENHTRHRTLDDVPSPMRPALVIYIYNFRFGSVQNASNVDVVDD